MKAFFQAFCDASGTFDHRFQSIGVVSGKSETIDQLRTVLTQITDEHKIKEIKFVDINRKDSRDYRAALAFIQGAIAGYCRYYRIRIDIMTWDAIDSRNSVPGRNDIENLARLYYHLLLSITRSWPEGEWDVIIDENEKVNFAALKACINNGLTPIPGNLPDIINPTDKLSGLNIVMNIREGSSHEEPLIQLSDLFAGLGRYSHEKGKECCTWLANNGNPEQLSFLELFPDNVPEKYSISQECRFQLIGELDKICKRYKLGVSLKTRKRLWSPDPKSPLNFWSYTPQGDYDKAPVG